MPVVVGGCRCAVPPDDGGRDERTERREKKAEERAAELRDAVKAILAETKRPMTRKELWDALPDGLRVNEVRFKEVLEEGAGAEWERSGSGRAEKGDSEATSTK